MDKDEAPISTHEEVLAMMLENLADHEKEVSKLNRKGFELKREIAWLDYQIAQARMYGKKGFDEKTWRMGNEVA